VSERQILIDRVNAVLRRHTDVASLTFARVGDSIDARLRLSGSGLIALRMHRLSATNFEALNTHQMSLFIADVRADQHDLASYQIADHIDDSVLWRCQSIILVTNGERIELL
jgi:hypothetical protein